MTRDEVMAMTDEELRVKAAELMGAKWYVHASRFLCIGECDWPESDGTEPIVEERILDLIPDYPNDIAAAWGLIPQIIQAGYAIDVTPGTMARLYRRLSASITDDYSIEATYSEVARFVYLGEGIGTADAQAITRSFILAMTQEDS